MRKKMCLKCKEVLPIGDFYSNQMWKQQSYADVYCRSCAQAMCKTQEDMKRYCWENNRVWSDKAWLAARKKADYSLSTNTEYLAAGTSKKRRTEIEEAVTCSSFFSVMNLRTFYGYVDNVGDASEYVEYDPNAPMITLEDGSSDTPQREQQNFSREWNGWYTPTELDYLDSYYSKLDEEFLLDNISIQDYARKVCRASLEADLKFNRMRRGECTHKEWQETQKAFDEMSKSANFAACQRKGEANAGMTSISEIMDLIEIEGMIEKVDVVWEQDHIDLVCADFRYTDVAVS